MASREAVLCGGGEGWAQVWEGVKICRVVEEGLQVSKGRVGVAQDGGGLAGVGGVGEVYWADGDGVLLHT